MNKVVKVTNTYKISGSQAFWLFATFEVGMTMLLTTTSAITDAKQDAWISFAIAGLCAIMLGFVGMKLSLLYPHQTFIEYTQTILGKWLGKIILLVYFAQWYSVIGIILRQSSDFIKTVLFHTTPLLAIVLLMLATVVFTVWDGGIEGIGRMSEITGPIVFVTIFVGFLLDLTNVSWKQLLPVYFNSAGVSILKGTVSPLSFLGESSMVTMVVAFMTEPRKGSSRAILGVGVASLTACVTSIMVVATLGAGLAAKMWYPYFDVVRFISIADFIQNVDSLVVIVWILSVFIKISFFFFVATYGTAQWLGITTRWKTVIWFVSPVVVILAMIYPNIDVSSGEFPTRFAAGYLLPVNMTAIPLILWVVGVIRKAKNKA